MLFRKDITRCCSYCQYATICDDGQITCRKKGNVDAEHSCWLFRYDPCKRIPLKAKALDFSQYTEDDFKL